jgi:hypothetical protein
MKTRDRIIWNNIEGVKAWEKRLKIMLDIGGIFR